MNCNDSSDDARLLAQIQLRRNDRVFMRRLKQLVEDERDVLERLALPRHSQDCLDEMFRFHASTGGDAACTCGAADSLPGEEQRE